MEGLEAWDTEYWPTRPKPECRWCTSQHHRWIGGSLHCPRWWHRTIQLSISPSPGPNTNKQHTLYDWETLALISSRSNDNKIPISLLLLPDTYIAFLLHILPPPNVTHREQAALGLSQYLFFLSLSLFFFFFFLYNIVSIVS